MVNENNILGTILSPKYIITILMLIIGIALYLWKGKKGYGMVGIGVAIVGAIGLVGGWIADQGWGSAPIGNGIDVEVIQTSSY